MPDQKGQVFEEWLKEFLDAAGGEGDEDASWVACEETPLIHVHSAERMVGGGTRECSYARMWLLLALAWFVFAPRLA